MPPTAIGVMTNVISLQSSETLTATQPAAKRTLQQSLAAVVMGAAMLAIPLLTLTTLTSQADNLVGGFLFVFAPVFCLLYGLRLYTSAGAPKIEHAVMALIACAIITWFIQFQGPAGRAEILRMAIPAFLFLAGCGLLTRRQWTTLAGVAVASVGINLVLGVWSGGFLSSAAAGASFLACGFLLLSSRNTGLHLLSGLFFGGAALTGSAAIALPAIGAGVVFIASTLVARKSLLCIGPALLTAGLVVGLGAISLTRSSNSPDWFMDAMTNQPVALRHWIQQPLSGNGPMSVYERFLKENRPASYSAHGDLAEWLSDFGLLGIAVIVGIALGFTRASTRGALLATAPFWAVLFIRALMDSDIHGGQIGMLVACVAGASIRPATTKRSLIGGSIMIGLAVILTVFASQEVNIRKTFALAKTMGRDNSFKDISQLLIQLDPANRLNLNIARSMLRYGFYGEDGCQPQRMAEVIVPATRIARRLVAADPSAVQAASFFAMAMKFGGGDPTEVIAACDVAYPGNPDTLWAKVQIAEYSRRPEARELAKEFLSTPQNPADKIDQDRRKTALAYLETRDLAWVP